MNARENNFDEIRLFGALLVIWGHAVVLAGLPREIALSMPVQAIGVNIFFVISGYLIAKSWIRDPHPVRYLIKRSLRIFPALVICVIFTAFIIGPLFTQVSLRDYFTDPQFADYFWNIPLRPNYALPGVFPDNPFAYAVNGSLWTLPVEFAAYLLAPFLILSAQVRKWGIVILMLIIATWLAFDLWGRALDPSDHAPWIVWGTNWIFAAQRITYFWFGSAVALLGLERFLRLDVAIFLMVLVWLAPDGQGLFKPLPGWLVIPYLTLTVAMVAPKMRLLSRITRRGDYSYGLYLYAFPIQQGLIVLFGAAAMTHTLLFAGLTTIVTTVLAVMSWHWVEKPALALKPSRHRNQSVVAQDGVT